MSEFKAGDKVREKSTGDEGVIFEKRDNRYSDSWWVNWKTGCEAGECLHIMGSEIEIIEHGALFTREQLAFLDERYGFKKDE